MRAQQLITALVRHPDAPVHLKSGAVVVGFEIQGGTVVLEAVSNEAAPQTPGSWAERCAVLHEVVRTLARRAGMRGEVYDALEVAAGRGDVAQLLPWPKGEQ